MYRTSAAIKTYDDPWATVFRVGLAEVCMRICGYAANPNSPARFGVKIFDRLTPGQKVAMLAAVGSALLLRDAPEPERTATLDGTAAAIIRVFVEELLDELCKSSSGMPARPGDAAFFKGVIPPTVTCRLAVRNIYLQKGSGWNPKDLPDVLSRDADRWAELGDLLEEFVFGDRDFEEDEPYSDLYPAADSELREISRAEDDNSGAIAPKPSTEELKKHIATLERLTARRLEIEKVPD